MRNKRLRKITNKLQRGQDHEQATPETGVPSRAMPRPWRISLIVIDQGVEVVFDLVDSMMLGHTSKSRGHFDGIDLSPFDVYEKGVSRRHAVLQLDRERVVLIDNNSTNGTQLNHKTLLPEVAYPLRSGDIITLGMLDLRIELLISPFDL